MAQQNGWQSVRGKQCSCVQPQLQQAVTPPCRYHASYGVQLDPSTQALSLLGSQEGLAHLLMAVADPGVQVVRQALVVLLAGGTQGHLPASSNCTTSVSVQAGSFRGSVPQQPPHHCCVLG